MEMAPRPMKPLEIAARRIAVFVLLIALATFGWLVIVPFIRLYISAQGVQAAVARGQYIRARRLLDRADHDYGLLARTMFIISKDRQYGLWLTQVYLDPGRSLSSQEGVVLRLALEKQPQLRDKICLSQISPDDGDAPLSYVITKRFCEDKSAEH